jgi:hypothetical protein
MAAMLGFQHERGKREPIWHFVLDIVTLLWHKYGTSRWCDSATLNRKVGERFAEHGATLPGAPLRQP